MRRLVALCLAGLIAGCGGGTEATRAPSAPLYPGETPQMRALVQRYAARHEIPEALLHKVIQRESD